MQPEERDTRTRCRIIQLVLAPDSWRTDFLKKEMRVVRRRLDKDYTSGAMEFQPL